MHAKTAVNKIPQFMVLHQMVIPFSFIALAMSHM